MPKLRRADITLRQRVTLAWLIYRGRFAGASVSWLSKKTFFDRKTVRKHLEKLAAKKYVVETDNGWVAIDNERYTHKDDRTGKKWFEGICYFRVNLPDRPIKNWTNHCLFMLVHYSKGFTSRRQTTTGIARMLGVSRASVIAAIDYLTTINAKGHGPWIAAASVIGPNGQKVGWKFSKLQ
ncbi:MAG: hypothetical protein ABSG53_34380 [Thermoguttaceae bacterium]